MRPKFVRVIQSEFRRLLNDNIEKIEEINKKYEKPRITMTPAVRYSLMGLRYYLMILVGILVFKFFTLVFSGINHV